MSDPTAPDTNASTLRTLAYVSVATHRPSDDELLHLAVSAQKWNAKCAVTGLLISDALGFLQTIEGAPTAIDEVFKRISADTLHHEIDVFVDEPVINRLYPDWAMLNTMQNSALTIHVALAYARDHLARELTKGQATAVQRSLQRISR